MNKEFIDDIIDNKRYVSVHLTTGVGLRGNIIDHDDDAYLFYGKKGDVDVKTLIPFHSVVSVSYDVEDEFNR